MDTQDIYMGNYFYTLGTYASTAFVYVFSKISSLVVPGKLMFNISAYMHSVREWQDISPAEVAFVRFRLFAFAVPFRAPHFTDEQAFPITTLGILGASHGVFLFNKTLIGKGFLSQ